MRSSFPTRQLVPVGAIKFPDQRDTCSLKRDPAYQTAFISGT